jgi:hypothetical protein
MVVYLQEIQKLILTEQLGEINYIRALGLQCFYFKVHEVHVICDQQQMQVFPRWLRSLFFILQRC